MIVMNRVFPEYPIPKMRIVSRREVHNFMVIMQDLFGTLPSVN